MEKRNQSSRDTSSMGGQKSSQSGSSKQSGQQMKSGQQGSHTSGTRESTAKGGSSHSSNK